MSTGLRFTLDVDGLPPDAFDVLWNPDTRTEVTTPCISQFRHSAQIRPSQTIVKDYTFKQPGWAGRFEHQGEHQDYQRTQYEVFDYPGRFRGAFREEDEVFWQQVKNTLATD